MALPVTMYRSTDAGAPVIISGKPSEYLTVLKKCLVDGYGEKLAAGWSVVDEVSAPPYLALSNSDANGVLMFSSPDDNAGTDVKVQSCLDYIDQQIQNRKGAYFVFDRSLSGNVKNTNWIVFATSSAFWIFAWGDNLANANKFQYYNVISFFAGNLESFHPNDPAKFITLCGKQNSNSVGEYNAISYLLSNNLNTPATQIYSLDDSNEFENAAITSLFGNESTNKDNVNGIAPIQMLVPMYLMMGDGSLKNSSKYSGSSKFPYVRGLVPGLFVADAAGHRDEPMPVFREFNGSTYYLIPSHSGTLCCWINAEEW